MSYVFFLNQSGSHISTRSRNSLEKKTASGFSAALKTLLKDTPVFLWVCLKQSALSLNVTVSNCVVTTPGVNLSGASI